MLWAVLESGHQSSCRMGALGCQPLLSLDRFWGKEASFWRLPFSGVGSIASKGRVFVPWDRVYEISFFGDSKISSWAKLKRAYLEGASLETHLGPKPKPDCNFKSHWGQCLKIGTPHGVQTAALPFFFAPSLGPLPFEGAHTRPLTWKLTEGWKTVFL